MCLRTIKHIRSKTVEFKITKDPDKVLGTFLSYNQNKNVEESFLNRIRKSQIYGFLGILRYMVTLY